MPRFQVNIEGKHFLSTPAGGDSPQPIGFYVVRYVKADDPDAAQHYVLEYFKKEVESKLTATPRSTVHVTECKAVESMEGNAFFEGGISGTEIMTYPETAGVGAGFSGTGFFERLKEPLRSLLFGRKTR